MAGKDTKFVSIFIVVFCFVWASETSEDLRVMNQTMVFRNSTLTLGKVPMRTSFGGGYAKHYSPGGVVESGNAESDLLKVAVKNSFEYNCTTGEFKLK